MPRLSVLWAYLLILGFTATLTVGQDIDALKESLESGGVEAVFPDEAEYADASAAFNERFTTQPVAVAYPVGAEQISAAIQAGSAQGVPVVARSGGHSYIANGVGGTDGALVVDLSKNTALSVNSTTGQVTVQTGLRLGDIAEALNAYGRAMPHGRCSYVGSGGHSGHGGYGHHSRMWGLILDVIEEITVVIPDGSIVTASEIENSDLFWALRGSSSSYGIVYEFKAKTFEAPPEASIFHFYWSFLPITNATSAISSFQSFVTSNIPSTLGGELVLSRGAVSGQIGIDFFGGYWGTHDSFQETVQPFLDTMPTPDNTSLVQGDWFEGLESWVYLPLNTSLASDVKDTFYAKSLFSPEQELLSNETIESFVTYLSTDGFSTNTSWFVEVELYGGSNSAINAVPQEQTAFVHRSTLFNFQLYASSFNAQPPYPDEGLDFVQGMADSLTTPQPDIDWAAYVGYPDERLDDWQDLYYKSHYPRLQELKGQYDPNNTFRFPLSIELP